MTDNVNGIRGEFRRLTAQEIGMVIRLHRTSTGMKRASLAAEANMSEKTLERAESGQGISEESCRRIATALGIEADAFTRELYVPTPQEAERQAKQQHEERKANFSALRVSELKGVRDVLPAFKTHGLLADDSHVDEQDLAAFAELKQSCRDWGDLSSDITEPELLEGCRSFLAEVRDFEALGYVVKAGVTKRYSKEKRVWSIVVLVAFKRPKGDASTPVEVWVPKKMRMGF